MKNFDLARVRHHSLEAEASFLGDARRAMAIGNDLRSRRTLNIGAGKIARNVVGINVLAELDPVLDQHPGQRCLSGAVWPGHHQQEWLIQTELPPRPTRHQLWRLSSTRRP